MSLTSEPQRESTSNTHTVAATAPIPALVYAAGRTAHAHVQLRAVGSWYASTKHPCCRLPRPTCARAHTRTRLDDGNVLAHHRADGALGARERAGWDGTVVLQVLCACVEAETGVRGLT